MRGGTAARVAIGIVGLFAGLLILFLIVGIILPNEIEVSRSVQIEAPPDLIFPHLNTLEAWSQWTPWGDIESTLEGPAEGPGAKRTWDNPNLGSGSLTITESTAPTILQYRAEVEEGTINFIGTFRITPDATGSQVQWTETASWGLNPLLGWNGLTLEGSQGTVIQESLERLKGVAEQEVTAPTSP